MTQTQTRPLGRYLSKIGSRTYLPEREQLALLELPCEYRQAPSHTILQTEHSLALSCIFVLEGLVSRQKTLGDKRQIVGFAFPGDAVNLQLSSNTIDYSVVTHGRTTVALVLHADLADLVDRYPLLGKVLWHDCLVEAAIFREWALNVGHRRAGNRIGHLLLECERRIHTASDDANVVSFDLPLTQSELAAALGLSLVHLNKSVRRLREEELIDMSNRTVTLKDRERLVRFVNYDDRYLHRVPDSSAAFEFLDVAPHAQARHAPSELRQ